MATQRVVAEARRAEAEAETRRAEAETRRAEVEAETRRERRERAEMYNRFRIQDNMTHDAALAAVSQFYPPP